MNSVHLKGADELDKALAMLPEEIGRRVLNRAVLAGARVVAKEMKIRAPVGDKAHETVNRKGKTIAVRMPGYLKKNVRARMALPREYGAIARLLGHNRFVVAAVAGVSSKAFYARFIEWGWMLTRKTRTGKKRLRFVGPQPFLRPAWDAVKMRALETIGVTLAQGIDEAARRLAGRYATSGFSRRGRSFIK